MTQLLPAGSRPVRFGRLARLNREPTNRVLRIFAPWIHRVLRIWTRADWRGTENIPISGPAIVVPNHISSLDPVLVGEFLVYNGRWPHFLARANLFDNRIMGRLLRAAEQIPVFRASDKARDSLQAAEVALAKGHVVVIYPEGTITFDPDEWPMAGHTGAARLALRVGAPMIPIGQWGANYALPPRGIRPFRLRRTPVTLVAGPAIDLDEFNSALDDREAARAATTKVMDTITALVEQVRGQTAPVDRWHPKLDRRVPRAEAVH
ncbi:MAG: lysophospholipid acyltransferase family protein [Brooklawnia sp.]|uniref:lysophospholipid acyltransferase family protein n=1 Tax=Brooklawnia sp. TaxID=2699740 RepID=UPI003C71A50A